VRERECERERERKREIERERAVDAVCVVAPRSVDISMTLCIILAL
jgi:hypothetical protein